jgi:phospholipase D1/2
MAEIAQESGVSASMRPTLLAPGRNCWRVETARRFRLLIDGEQYFTALRQAILLAQDTVFILGWDIDSRMKLVPNGANDGFPEPFGEFLQAVVKARPRLRIYILAWDFAMLYAFEREWVPVFKRNWCRHRRLLFRQDATHPPGASHHQKIVLIDDRLAFTGGLDLTRSRWDTSEHAAANAARLNPDGRPYGPFHDVQCMFDGPAAAAVGELVRERWRRASGRVVGRAHARRPGHDTRELWPEGWTPEVTDVSLGLARTEPHWRDHPAIEEIRELHADAIRAARRHVYIENQYFTSGIVGEAIGERLSGEASPEFVVISRESEEGWLEQVTMGILRARLHHRLRQDDKSGRYRMFAPRVPELRQGCVNVHSKIMFVDDELLLLGSANLNNRSMVLDTEFNIALDARGEPRVRQALAAMRGRLLGEHLGVSEASVAAQLHASGSLIETIMSLRSEGRSLVPLEPEFTPELDALVPVSAMFDPEKPAPPDEAIRQFMPHEPTRRFAGRIAVFGGLALLIALLAVLWQATPLRHYLNPEALAGLTRSLEALPLAPLWIVSGYVLAGVLAVPITVLIAATGIVFGAVNGTLYALSGTMISAAITYLIGKWLGRDTIRKVAGKRINKLSERFARQGIVAMVVLRLLPVAPFTVVNFVAGASHIRMRDYLFGTLLGMGPGIVITVAFAHQLGDAIRHPTLRSFLVLVLVGLALVAVSVLLQRFFGKRQKETGGADGEGRTAAASLPAASVPSAARETLHGRA